MQLPLIDFELLLTSSIHTWQIRGPCGQYLNQPRAGGDSFFLVQVPYSTPPPLSIAQVGSCPENQLSRDSMENKDVMGYTRIDL